MYFFKLSIFISLKFNVYLLLIKYFILSNLFNELYSSLDIDANASSVASIISNDMYRDIEEVILLFMQEIKNEVIDRKKRNDKRKVDEVVRVIFFRDINTLEIHTVKHIRYKPYMYDIIPYLKRSSCLGHTNEYPYNAIIFKSFCRKSIMQISAC